MSRGLGGQRVITRTGGKRQNCQKRSFAPFAPRFLTTSMGLEALGVVAVVVGVEKGAVATAAMVRTAALRPCCWAALRAVCCTGRAMATFWDPSLTAGAAAAPLVQRAVCILCEGFHYHTTEAPLISGAHRP